MSYILDALRKAEAERQRGHVPGLHSQAAAPSAVPAGARRTRAPWPMLAGLAGVAMLGGGAWWLARGEAPAATPIPIPAPAPVALAPVPAPPAPAPTPAPAAPALAAPPADGVPPPPRTLFPPAPLPPEPTPAPPPAVTPVPAPAAAPTPAPAPAPDRVVPYDKLPPEQKRQLPVLSIGGAIYSDSAAQRMLIVGGQLLHEGDSVAPGVVLEQIKPKAAVLRKDQLRWEVSF